MKVRAFYPVTLTIDGEEVVLRIKRMNMEEYSEFSNRGALNAVPTSARFVSRGNSAEEQERDEEGNYKIPLAQLATRKVRELGPEKLAEYEAAVKADEVEARKFLVYIFESFVTVEKGLLEELADGSESTITDGLDVLRVFGARNDILATIVEAIRLENELTADQKKVWKSGSDSSFSSTELDPAPVGPQPATTAENVKTSASAVIAAAPRRQAPRKGRGRSGSTGRSSSKHARSSS